MEKLAVRSVVWHVPTTSYQIRELTEQGTVTTSVNEESAVWKGWLERVPSFSFHSRDGRHLTAVKERRMHGSTYWIAYRGVGGTLKRKYLGAPTRVTLAQLEQAAAALTESRPQTAIARPPSAKGFPSTVDRNDHRTPWQASLVATKFFVPAPSHALISRPRLTDLLNEGFIHKLTLISAPAGFGKTTLVASWVRSLPRDQAQVAWVSLDSRDNDPVRFWMAVLTALEQRAPGHFHQALALLHAQPTPALEYVLSTLINILIETETPWVLLLDDYHVISEPAIHAQLSYLLEYQPPSMHLLLLSRSDPPLSLPRLRARGQILEVHTEQLRTTLEETAAFLADVMGIELPAAVLKELAARTEGWLIGLQLVGLSLRRSADPAAMLEEVRGSQRYILDYLVEEVLQQQPASVQRFMLRTSILEQLCAPLCDAVTGEPNSQQILEELERANVFVVPLDGRRQWYRYHALIAEALRYRLEQQHADEVDGLHVRASTWYVEQGNTFEAVQHALLAHTWQLVADLIEHTHYSPAWTEGQGTAVRLRQWLDQLPADVVRERPQLSLVYAQALHLVSPPATVEAWLKAAEATLTASIPMTATTLRGRDEQQNLLGEPAAFRAVLASYQGYAQVSLALCQQVFALLSPRSLAVRADVLLAQTVAYFIIGEASAASRSELEAERLTHAVGNVQGAILSLSMAALRLMACGRLHEVWQVLERAVRLANEPGGVMLPRIDLAYAYQAELLREWNRLDEALALVTEAIHWAEQLATPTVMIAYALQARLLLSRGEPEAARAALERCEQVVENVDTPQELAYLSSLHTTVTQMQLWLAQGELADAAHWAEHLLAQGGSNAAMGREREEVALIRLLLAQDRPAKARTRVTPLLERATQQERWGNVIELRLLQAEAQSLLHEEQEALAALAHAVRLAEPEGYVRLFVDEGPLMETLLRQLWERERKRGPTPYLDTLLAIFPAHEQAHVSPRKLGLLDPLSTREREVLPLMARGASNQEIAEALVITVDTVKRHVGNILGKLQANNRTQAVAQARTLGLLADEAL